MTELTELRKTTKRLADVDERRESLVEYRDRQIIDALAGGATWVAVQDATGLSPRGLQLAIKRAGGVSH